MNTKINNTKINNAKINNARQLEITDPATGITQPAVGLPAGRIADLVEILDHCYGFLTTSSRNVRGELADYCLARPNLTSGALIDMIGFSALRLRTTLQEADQQPVQGPNQNRGLR